MIKRFFSRMLGSEQSNHIIVSGNGSIAIQGSNVVVNGTRYNSKSNISIVNDEVFIDGFNQGDVDSVDFIERWFKK